MRKAFISYTRTKDDFGDVEKLQKRLLNECQSYEPEVKVFLDKQALAPGDIFSEVIEAEVKDSDLFVILLSPAWLTSTYCIDEYDCFVAKEKTLGLKPRLLPILWVKEKSDLDNAANNEVLSEMLQINYLEFWAFRHLRLEDANYANRIAEIARTAREIAGRS